MNQLISPWHLKYFYDSVRLNSLTKAAELNHITRPAISKAIKSLEAALGVELLIHKKKAVEVSAEGQILFAKIPSILESFTELKREVQSGMPGPQGILKIGTSHSLALSLFPGLLSHLARKFPQLRVNIQLGRTDMLKSWILDGVVDVAVTLDDGRLRDFQSENIRSGNFILFGKKNAKVNRLMTTFDRPEVRKVHSWNRANKAQNRFSEVLEVDSWEVLFRFASQGMGTALIPDFVAVNSAALVRPGFRCPYSMVAFTGKSAVTSVNVKLLIQELKGWT